MPKTMRQVRRDSRAYYSPTSEALQQPQARPKRIPKPKVVRKGWDYRNVGQTQKPFSLCTLATVVLLFGVSLGIVVGYSLVWSSRIEVRDLEGELRQIQEENNLIRAQIAELYDINEIERIASTRLMMGRPLPHQVVHIYVPRN